MTSAIDTARSTEDASTRATAVYQLTPSAQKRILLVHYNPDSHGQFVGLWEGRARRLSESHQLFCLIPREGQFTKAMRDSGVTILHGSFHENHNPLAYAAAGLKFAALLRKHKIDLVYLIDYTYWKPVEILVCRAMRVPVVANIHFKKEEETFKGFLSKCDYFITNSYDTAREFNEHGFGKRTFVAHNSIRPADYDDIPDIHEQLCGPQERLIGFVGALQEIKGIEVLLRALAKVVSSEPGVRLAIVGKEKAEGFERKLRELTHQLGLDEKVDFIGHRKDIPALMRAFDILAVPSLYEAFGFVNIEAGAAGTPVVASNVGGIPEIIVPGKTGLLVEPGNSSALAGALLELLTDPERRIAMGQAARQHVQKYFSEEALLLQYHEIVNRTLGLPLL